MMEFCEYRTPVGTLFISASGGHITAIDFKKPAGEIIKDGFKEPFAAARKWLDIYFSGKEPDFIPPISLEKLSPFRKRVCEIMLEIKYGHMLTYGGIAKRIESETGKRVSAQAVGGAVGKNPVAIIIPCHRVIGAGGNLTGYAGGLDRKIYLLNCEGIDVKNLHMPKNK